ncbi:hypothetical protein ACSVDA_15475 [Cytobacillus sp. Hm23]
MKVQVKDFPVRYRDERYLKGETFIMAAEYFNDSLLIDVEEDDEEE